MTFYFISLGAYWAFCDGPELETRQKTGRLAVSDQSWPSGPVTARLRFGFSAWLLQRLGVRVPMSYVVWPLSVRIFSFTTWTGKNPGLSSQLQMAPKHIGVMKTMFLNDQTRNGLRALNLWEWSQHLTSPTERRWTLEPNFFKSFWNFFSYEREKEVSV